jgi:LacI family transcriptional regulator
MYDVARAAGVSQTTVSLVVNNAPNANIPEATRDRIWTVIRELDWRPNALARGLSQRQTRTIGMISDEIATSPHGGKMIQGTQDALWARSNMLLLASTGGQPDVERAALDMMLERRVDGLIIAAMYHRPVVPPRGLDSVPTVLVDCFAEDQSLPSVVPNEVGAAYTATEFLLGQEHRLVAFINSEHPPTASAGRLAGYKAALAEYDIDYDPRLVRRGHNGNAREGYRCMQELLGQRFPPTAVFCFNDSMAMGAYEAIKEKGLKIPGDVAVVGFDNHELLAAELNPPLTTLELPHYEMGRWAVDYLLDDDTDWSGPPAQHMVECRLVERGSVERS